MFSTYDTIIIGIYWYKINLSAIYKRLYKYHVNKFRVVIYDIPLQ